MNTYIPLYNMISSKFMNFSKEYPTVEEILDSKDYITMPQLRANDIEEVYEILNIHHPVIHTDKVKSLKNEDPFFTKYESLHSSLSICDVVIEIKDNKIKYFYCDNCGWKELE
jgi:hypothetical protein